MASDLTVYYVRAPANLRAKIKAAADEDMRSIALETGYLIQLGLEARAAQRKKPRSASARSAASDPLQD